MPTHLAGSDIALRLLLTVIASSLIGLNREEHGRPAGLRTMLLVGLAACLSMIQVNLLLPIAGKAPDSFIVMDLMRLPLGILSGMGFIGAGAVLRKENAVTGVTTAATLWFVTVLGLCFGGGQLLLGTAGSALGLIVLCLLKPVESRCDHERHARLIIAVMAPGPTEKEITEAVAAAGYQAASLSVTHEKEAGFREVRLDVKWEGKPTEVQPPAFVAELARWEKTLKIAWQPQTADSAVTKIS